MSRRALSIVAAAALAVTTFATPAASAQTAVDCSQNKFAVGGYPRPDIVPAGYQYVPTPGGIFAWERGGYLRGQTVGAANVVSTVDNFAAACPDTQIFLEGHSYGAAIIATAVSTIDNRPYAGRVNVQLTGNPRRVGGIEQAYRGFNLFGLNFRGSLPAPVNVASYVDLCNPRDGICNLPPIFRNPLGHFLGIIGYFTGAHRYPAFPPNPSTPSAPVIPVPEALLSVPPEPAPAPVVIPDAPAPEVAPAPAPSVTAEVAPSVTAEVAPEATSEAVPEVTSEAVPEPVA